MHILVTGATGYIGGRLIPELVAAGHRVRCLARTPAKLDRRPWRDEVEVVAGDIGDPVTLDRALDGIDAAYYLVHSMDSDGGFVQRDRQLAASFRDAAARADLDQIIYVGGLGDSGRGDVGRGDVGRGDGGRGLSRHLRSRQEVGRILAEGPVPVTELRAAVIIGSGSASFEMVRNLVEVLPIMVTPRWVRNRCQPIAIRDVLYYLVGVLGLEEARGRVLEIGGPDVLTYGELMQTYATVAGLRRRIMIPVPLVTPKLSSLWVGLVTPIPVGLAKPLVESLEHDVVVHDDTIARLLPRRLLTFREAVGLALRRIQDLDVSTSWSQAERFLDRVAEPQPDDPDWSGGTVVADVRTATASASPSAVFRAVTGIGGDRGYYTADLLWEIRGLADKIVGGIGVRRGRRHPDDLAVGEALDFWRVEALEPGRLMRLRAEMKLPGEAWLEFAISPVDGDGTVDGTSGSTAGARLVQRALFHPRGLLGRVYWYALWPFHQVIFARMVRRIAEAAEVTEAAEHLPDVTARMPGKGPSHAGQPDPRPDQVPSSTSVT